MAQTETGFSLKRATGISAGLHLLLVPLLLLAPPLFDSPSPFRGGATAPGEQLATSLSLEHRPRPRRHEAVAVARAAAPAPAPPKLSPTRQIVAPRVVHDAAAAGVPAEGVQAPEVARAAGADAAGPIEPKAPPASQQSARDTVPASAATPPPAPAPTVAAGAAAAAVAVAQKPAPESGGDASAGSWGQNFDSPMLADETELADLKAKYHVKGITVKVDESGHVVRVILPASVPLDARDEITARLSALHYVPAECNGLRCAGTLVVSL